MKLETVKSFVLIILVGSSLFLSFIMWNYHVNYDTVEQAYVDEANLGGDEQHEKEILRPHSVVFHSNHKVYGFSEAKEQIDLYENILEWELTDYSLESPPNINAPYNMVELSYPTSIPLELILDIFKIDEKSLPSWEFKRVVIIPNGAYANLDVYFISEKDHEAARFIVNKPDPYAYVTAFFNDLEQLEPYLSFDTGQDVFYIPQESVEMEKRSLSAKLVDRTVLINALFPNPSLVSHTIGESSYNDGQRMLNILNDGRSMEYTNPVQSKDRVSKRDLIELSIEDLNEHKGWTDDFQLEHIHEEKNLLQYKMYYLGYPIFSHEDYSMIEQQWKDQDLYQYKRPLFTLTNLLNSETVTLPSGREVISFLEEEKNYNIEKITDIRLGYRLKYDDTFFNVTLDPTWYLHYNGRWIELTLDASDLYKVPNKGGLKDAVEPN